MRFLIDAQLPPVLVRKFADRGHVAEHVNEIGLGSAPDRALWHYAVEHHAVLVTKDEDFSDMLLLLAGDSPVVVWVRVGNTRRQALLDWFEALIDRIVELVSAGSPLVLMRGSRCVAARGAAVDGLATRGGLLRLAHRRSHRNLNGASDTRYMSTRRHSPRHAVRVTKAGAHVRTLFVGESQPVRFTQRLHGHAGRGDGRTSRRGGGHRLDDRCGVAGLCATVGATAVCCGGAK